MPSTIDQAAISERAEGVRCPWCAAVTTAGRSPLSTCCACGAATTFPVPSDDQLERAYSTWYRPAGGRFGGGGDALLALSRATLARRLDRIAPPGPVLDVGAGDGALVRALRARGRDAIGLERVAGDGVVACGIDAFDGPPGQWAAVVFWHSLEHLRDPAQAVDRAVALLAPGGVLVIATPNLSSWQARCFGERWFHLDIPRHLVHLPASALQRGVRARGLTIERTSYWRGGQVLFGWLHGIVRLLPGAPISTARSVASARRMNQSLAYGDWGYWQPGRRSLPRPGRWPRRGHRARRWHRLRRGPPDMITGERVSTGGGGFNPTWQRHVAAYGLCAPLLPPGACSTSAAVWATRTSARAARDASGPTSTPSALAGQDRETVAADMRELPFDDGSYARLGGPVDRARAGPRASAARRSCAWSAPAAWPCS